MRISRQQMFAEMAMTIAKRATCNRANVGALITQGNNVVSIGYNGPKAGELHCSSQCFRLHTLGCARSDHAEANAIKRLDEDWIAPWGLNLYTTRSPCESCTELILRTEAITRVFYIEQYRNTEHLSKLHGKKQVYRILPSGVTIDHFTGEVVELENSSN